jgi:cytochrome c oxidase subunit 2
MMMQGVLACATCHGANGHGGTVNFMMQSYDVPNITWPELTGPDPDMEHPPYTEETLKRAITQGLDPGGNELEYPMPRWQMSEQDLNDLVSFIKTLK